MRLFEIDQVGFARVDMELAPIDVRWCKGMMGDGAIGGKNGCRMHGAVGFIVVDPSIPVRQSVFRFQPDGVTTETPPLRPSGDANEIRSALNAGEGPFDGFVR